MGGQPRAQNAPPLASAPSKALGTAKAFSATRPSKEKVTVTSARKTGRPWRRPNARAISAATDPPAHPTRPQKVKSIPAMCETSAAEHKQTVRVPQGDCAVIIVATYVLESICYLLRVDYDGAGCVPSFCRLRQVYRTSPDSSCDAGHGYVSGCVRWLHGHTSMVTRRGRCSEVTSDSVTIMRRPRIQQSDCHS